MVIGAWIVALVLASPQAIIFRWPHHLQKINISFNEDDDNDCNMVCFNKIYTATGHDPIDFEGDAEMDVLHDDLHPVLYYHPDCLLVLARADPYRSLVIRLPFADLAASSLSLR